MPENRRPSKQEADWEILTIPILSGGLNTRGSPELIDGQETPRSENMSFREERTRSDLGYIQFADITLVSLHGQVQGVYQHRTAAGTTEDLLVTKLSLFSYNLTNDAWEIKPGGVLGDGNTTLSSGETLGTTVIRVADTVGFTVGKLVGIRLDDGTQDLTTVVSISAGVSITIFTGLTDDAASGLAMIQGPVFAGTDVHQIVFVPVPEKEWTAFTNGVDVPFKYDGSTCEIIPNLPFSGNIICRTMVMFKNTLVLMNIVENGSEKPYLVMWSDVGDVEEWVLGDAGNNPLVDARDDIIAANPLGRDIIIYRKKSIVRMEFVGAAFELFRWRTMVFGEILGAQGVGAASPNSVFALADQHIVLAQEGIYLYKGGISIELISQKLFAGTFDRDGDVDPNKSLRNFSQYFDRTNEVYFMYADLENTFPSKALVLDVETFRWRKRKFLSTFVGSGIRTEVNATGIAIINLVGTIIEQTWIIGGAAAQGGIPDVMLVSPTTTTVGRVVRIDYITEQEADNDIAWRVETKDFRAGDRLWRVDWIEIKVKGPAVTIEKSYDNGRSFTDVGVTTATGAFAKSRFFIQEVTEQVRFKFSADSGGAELGVIQFKIREEARWDL